MECKETTWLSDKEYVQQFYKKVAQQRVPLLGGLDLTRRCNLKCLHCYLGDQGRAHENGKAELDTAEWISIIDEICEAGCLHLLFTGGEPLVRKDFAEIYRHAKSRGFLIHVFTNGTRITERILKLFDDLPPHAVEITLYGASAETYESITRVKGSYAQCLNGIERLLTHRINLRLKTILMTLNHHEFYDIEKMAKEYGVKFRFDAAIFPCFNGDRGPILLRVTPEEAVEKEFSDKDRVQHWKDYIERTRGFSLPDTLYNCGAGLTLFHIDSRGNLQPCLMTIRYQYDLREGDFFTGWHEFIPRMRAKKAGANFPCNQCKARMLCAFCPAFFELENGAEDSYSEYLCAMGQLRFQAIENVCF